MVVVVDVLVRRVVVVGWPPVVNGEGVGGPCGVGGDDGGGLPVPGVDGEDGVEGVVAPDGVPELATPGKGPAPPPGQVDGAQLSA